MGWPRRASVSAHMPAIAVGSHDHIRPAPTPSPYDVLQPGHTALVIIDMQRDFIEPGGFGETLGNDVSLLEAIVPACSAVLAAWRAGGGWWCTPARPPARPVRLPAGQAPARQPQPAHRRCGAHGPHPGAGEPGNQIIPALAPRCRRIVIDKPGKGAFYATARPDAARTHLLFSGPRCACRPASPGHLPVLHRASPPRSACRPACARPTTAATTCLLVEDGTESYSSPASSSAATAENDERLGVARRCQGLQHRRLDCWRPPLPSACAPMASAWTVPCWTSW
jgi:hypothetical protein